MLQLLIIIFFLILLSAFFSGSETGLTAASKARIHRLKKEGNKRAGMVSQLRRDKERLIGTILLGNNAVNIAASALATMLAVEAFGDAGVIYVTIVMTLLVLIFAEVLPKTYAIQNAEKVALLVSPAFVLLVKFMYPITKLVQWLVDIVLLLFGLRHKEEDVVSSADALRGAIELHHEEGDVVKPAKDMLGGILDLAEVEVAEAMLHRKSMQSISIDRPTQEIVDFVLSSSHTRIPVWEENPDNIIGILHVKDLMRTMRDAEEGAVPFEVRPLLSEAWFVPETRALLQQLNAFRDKKQHFALVVDEYGDLQGLITLEDILEEIVGQIHDEYDEKRSGIRKQPNGSYLVDGSMSLRDINRELEWELPGDDAATIAGLVIHEAQIIPDIGQKFNFYGYQFEITKKNINQIMQLRIQKITNDPGI